MQNYAAHPATAASEAPFAAMHVTQAMHASGHPAYHHAGANEAMMAVNGVHGGPGVAGAGMFAPDMTSTQDGYVAPLNIHPAMDMSGLHHPSHDHHGFMPLPQAPRLPVAAARASAMSAMYYDPSLHPQHPLNGNFGPSAPWISNWHGNGLGATADHATAFNGAQATVHHRQLEQQLKMQNHLTQAHHHQQHHAQQPMASINGGVPVVSSAAANEPHTFGNVYAAPPLLVNGQHPSNFIDSSAPRQHSLQGRMPTSGAPTAFHAPSNVSAPQKHSAAQWTGNTHWSGAADRASHQAQAAHVGARHHYASGATASGMDMMNLNSNGHRVFAAPSATSNAYPTSASAAAAVGQQYYMATHDARQAMMHGADAAGHLDVAAVAANSAGGQWQSHRNADKSQYQVRASNKPNGHQYPSHGADHQLQAQQHHGQRSQSFQMPSNVAEVDYRYPGAQEAAAWAWMNGQQRPINDGNAWAMQNRAQERNHASQYHRGSLDSKLHQPTQWQGEHGGLVLPNMAVPAPMQKDQFAAQQPVYYPDVAAHQIAGAHGVKAPTATGPVHDHQSGAGTVMADANAQKNPAAPAPPSPDTLDKSAVPVSSVGAEIVWAAAAALLDPSLWLPSGDDVHRTTHQTRKRMASQGSSSDVSPLATPFTSPVQASNDGGWQQKSLATFDGSNVSVAHARPARAGHSSRLATDALDESSCSSSEPGTPPTALPSLRTWDECRETGAKGHGKRVSMSALHGMRSLGLSSNEDSSRVDWNSERRSASPMDTHSPRVRSFRRSESYDRSRETVSNVAGLLEWTWKWSINDDKLDSLRHWQRRNDDVRLDSERSAMPAVSPMTRQSSTQGRAFGRDENGSSQVSPTTGLTMSGTDPSPAFRRFTHQVLAQTLVSPTAFILGIMYALRVLHLAVAVDPVTGHAQVDPEAVEIFAQPYSAAPFKLFTLGLMIANKHLDDNTFLNKTWNEVTGISLAELNRAERWYLEKCSFEITVPEATWVAFLERLHARTERRISTFSSVKRIRVPITKEAPDAPRRPDSYVVPHAGSEESQKRFLFCIEEALQALGHAPDFTLNDDDRNGNHMQRNADAALVRPKSALTHLHQQSHSAPTVGVAHAGQSMHNGDGSQDDDDDVFDDEDGPYRPYDGSSRRGSQAHKIGGKGHVARNSIATDNVLNRSVSDSLTATQSSCAYQEHRAHAKSDLDVNQTSAPLAPSVLLELLNKGQHLAHAAH